MRILHWRVGASAAIGAATLWSLGACAPRPTFSPGATRVPVPMQPAPAARVDEDAARDQPVPHRYLHGVIADDAKFQIALPAAWNGKLVVASRGFSGTELTAGAFKTVALQEGYAFAASDEGWNRLTIASMTSSLDLRDSMPRFDPGFNPGGGALTDDELKDWDPAAAAPAVLTELRQLDLTGRLTRPVLMMHGTADAIVAPGETAGYVRLVEARFGREAARDLVAAYFIPGMGHGGKEYDALLGAQLDALERWIDARESGGDRGAPPPDVLGGYPRAR